MGPEILIALLASKGKWSMDLSSEGTKWQLPIWDESIQISADPWRLCH